MDEFARFELENLESDVRVDVLRRLAEQAMTDPDFRAVARDDLMVALKQFGYELNDSEMALVLRFRTALAEAGIDLFLQDQDSREYGELLQRLLP